MKRNTIFRTVLFFILFYGCAARQKVTYNIPASIPKERHDEIITAFKKGEELYKDNCSDCHGIFTNGKDKVPNFTNTQLDNYSIKFIKRDPANHAVARNMSPEQLNEVLTFLRFLKRDSVAATRRLR